MELGLGIQAPNESRELRRGKHRGVERTSTPWLNQRKSRLRQDETLSTDETVQLGREQSWICPNSKTSFGFKEENTKIESPLEAKERKG
ncbi:hypothetical protein Nepgr_007805 [Nepenthes gracilis]|uniref:Uncharacterized protein n=1 Tax=Nepenthes gracilis TaxID=150966 RepID=A0AAD3S7J1_NEPGR|nr:hypothetical protein Nepgr_007805 [Nepenthes gracilis]